MTGFAVVWVFVIGLILSGGNSGTTVILMPDESGKVGAITVKTPNDSRVIDQAYHSVTAKEGTTGLSATRALSEAQVYAEYADLLKSQPSGATGFVLYFVAGTSELTEESRAIIPRVVGAIKAQAATEVTIVGHTDTTGTDEANDRISLERARAVEKILKDSMPGLDEVTVKSFGSKDLLIPTPQNVDEPRNRRVEIIVL